MAKVQPESIQEDDESAQKAERSPERVAEIVENYIKLGRVALDSMLEITQEAMRKHSKALAEETVTNTFDFCHQLVGIKTPQELAQAQSRLLIKQAQAFTERTRELSQKLRAEANKIAKTSSSSADRPARRRKAA